MQIYQGQLCLTANLTREVQLRLRFNIWCESMFNLKFSLTIIAPILTAAILNSTATNVSAQAAYGSYIGVGVGSGLTSDDRDRGNEFAGLVAVRYKLLEVPISFRAQALIGEGVAVIPTISYDFPLSWQADAYVGVGASFAGKDRPSPVGDQTSLAVQPGLDFMLPNTNLVLFTNAIIAFDAYRQGGGTAISVQGGLGLRF